MSLCYLGSNKVTIEFSDLNSVIVPLFFFSSDLYDETIASGQQLSSSMTALDTQCPSAIQAGTLGTMQGPSLLPTTHVSRQSPVGHWCIFFEKKNVYSCPWPSF